MYLRLPGWDNRRSIIAELLIALVFILPAAGLLPELRGGAAKDSPEIPLSSVQYRTEPSDEWKPYRHPIRSRTDDGWLRISGREQYGPNARVFLFPMPNYYEVYQNGERVYTHGDPGAVDPRKEFMRWTIFPLRGASKEVYIRLQGKLPTQIAAGTESQVLKFMLKSDAVNMMNVSGSFFAGFFALLLSLFKRGMRLFLYYGLFVMLHFSIWPAFSYLLFKQLLFNIPGFLNFYIANTVEVADIALLLLLFREVMNPRYRKRVLWMVYLVIFAGLAFLTVITIKPTLTAASSIYETIITVQFLLMLVLAMLSIRNERNPELIWFVSGLAVFLMLEIMLNAAVVSAMTGVQNTVKLIRPFALIVPGAVIILRKYRETERRTAAYAEQLETLTLQLEEDNRQLEERVSKRTRDLETTYEKLVEAVHEGAAAMVEKVALEERNRIVQEIHDIVGHTLTTTIMQIEAGKRLIPHDPQQAIARMELSQKLVRKGLDEIRTSVRLLGDAEWNYDLPTSLTNVIEETQSHAGVRIDCVIGKLPELKMAHKNTIYMALKEGLTNGIKHGGSDTFTFILQHDREGIRFLLKNNGTPVHQVKEGFGLHSMKTKIECLNGTVVLRCEPDWGCVLDIRLPLSGG